MGVNPNEENLIKVSINFQKKLKEEQRKNQLREELLNMTTQQQIINLANEYLDFFEQKERANGEKFTTLAENTPDEVRDLVREAHLGELPNDFCYSTIFEVLDMIANDEDIEDIQADIESFQLLNWVSDNLSRQSYVDEILEELQPTTLFDALQLGQGRHKREIAESIRNSLESLLGLNQA